MEVLQCQNCWNGYLVPPANHHPAYLECDACGAIELTYEPQDYQEELHAIPYIYNEDGSIKIQVAGAFGGYGSGKSRASLAEVVLRALENPNGTGLLTAPTLQQLKRTTLKTLFNEVLPPPLIESYNKTDGEIVLVNGFTFYTIPSDDEEKLRSINCGIIHMEEASGIKRTIYDQLLTRIRDPFVFNKLFMVCSNPDLGWIKEIFADNIQRKNPSHPDHENYNPFIYTFIWATHLNHHLPPDFIEMNSKGKPDWWIKRYLMGSFEHSEGMVYPNIMKCVIPPKEIIREGRDVTDEFGIPTRWERFVTLDHGLRNPTAVYFHAIDPEKGEIITYLEYYVPNRLVPDHAKALKPLVEKIPHGRLRFMVADPSIRNKTDPVNGKSVQGLYQEYGLFFSEGNNSVEAGILRVNSYIERGKWKIYNTCTFLLKEGIAYKFPELDMDKAGENLDERPEKKFDHAMDSVRYGFMRLPEDPELLKLVAFEPQPSYTRAIMIENEYAWDGDDQEYGGRDWMSWL